jgi:hydrogenase maturation protein HypF
LRAEIRVSGIVQGVGFRPFVYRTAIKKGLVGFIRNRGDAGVEIIVEGEKNAVKDFLKKIREEKPPLAQIYGVTAKYGKDKGEFESFTIIKSTEITEFSGSVIPPDVSICDECLRELRASRNRRHNYFFITCTNCGPRYTIIEGLPYDRPNTTMKKFPVCDFCFKEYKDPSNRRFHAQTVACPKCGPKAYLTTNKGEAVDCKDPIREAGRLLEEGSIVAGKGNGGFHVATATTKSEPIKRLREIKHRAQKPFAIMARDLETIMSFAEVSREEVRLLTSYIKPIVLLKKREDYYLSELISPGLHTVGVMLPYTGLHVMLFDGVREPAFVMTSANPPSEPIVTENDEALKKLGSVVDYFLLHDRAIAQRCDDSVIRLHGKNQSVIRRSRGYAPAPIRLKSPLKRCVLGVGAELNVTACVLLDDKAFLSQHIGDIETPETLKFLRDAIAHLMRLTNSRVEIIACDLHPKFNTTRLAHTLGDKLDCPVIPVQHQHAHTAALMFEHDVDELVGIACDGYGYGSDGTAWGGEILYCNREGFQRLGHLQEQPMVGGDLAALYPLRMAAGILHGSADMEEWLLSKANRFPHGRKEVGIILKQLKGGLAPKTTSCGRVLDAVSALLGVCYERTYEGEPAMKLESAAVGGKNILNLTPKLRGKTLNTTLLLSEVFDKSESCSVADLASSTQFYLAKGLAQLAITEAERLKVKVIGYSGGVAHNEQITHTIRKIIEERGFRFLVHGEVPPGDGGIAFGQATVAALATS